VSATPQNARRFTHRAALVSVLLAPSAHAEVPPRVTLVWRVPAGCPERDAVLARVEQLLGERGATPSGPPLDVREFVTLTSDARFRAELGTVQAGVERSRSFEATTCSEIAEASAVVIALAISPDRDASEPTDARLAMPPIDSPSAAPAAPAPPPGETPRDTGVNARARPTARAAEWRSRVGAGVAADFGTVASSAPGVTVAGGLGYGRYLDLQLRGAFFPERSSPLASRPSEGVGLLLAAVAPLACVAPLELPVELGACAEVDVGYLAARGFGSPTYYHRGAWWMAPGGGLTAAYPRRSRFRTRLSADALFPLTRTQFVLTNVGVPHQLPVVAPRLGVYLELAFL
jgi:hypothetical protein